MDLVSRANQPFIDCLRLLAVFAQRHCLVQDTRVELQASKLHLFRVFYLRFHLSFTLRVLNLCDRDQGLQVVVSRLFFFILLGAITELSLHKRVIGHVEQLRCILVDQCVTQHRCSIPRLLGLRDQVNPDRLHKRSWVLMLPRCLLLWVRGVAEHSVTDQAFTFLHLFFFLILGLWNNALRDIRIRI